MPNPVTAEQIAELRRLLDDIICADALSSQRLEAARAIAKPLAAALEAEAEIGGLRELCGEAAELVQHRPACRVITITQTGSYFDASKCDCLVSRLRAAGEAT